MTELPKPPTLRGDLIDREARHVRVGENLWRDHIKATEEGRAARQAYLDALPTDPEERCKAIRKVLHPGSESYPGGLEEAMALSYALSAMVRHPEPEEWMHRPYREAGEWITRRVEELLRDVQAELDRVSDLASANSDTA